jgi:hypothetical protein
MEEIEGLGAEEWLIDICQNQLIDNTEGGSCKGAFSPDSPDAKHCKGCHNTGTMGYAHY